MKSLNSTTSVRVESAAQAAAIIREMHLRQSRQVPRRAQRGAFAKANVARGCELPKVQKEERVFVLPLDANGKMLAKPILVSVGDKDGTATIDAGSIFREALKAGAEEIIVAHNHPSGDLAPSKADLATTKELKDLSVRLGVTFLDHIIIGSADSAYGAGFTSLAESAL